ncbi:acetyl-CoA C-acetyltransferase [Thermosporothrix hazakensis]|jgi:acetyl-CoA C-acetyltransferase|uniref:acetyl-CoA C-acetyltransferase n=2 Tax=Thermosporothrix TaxID=768650 RepID=A0A326U6W8_THEHA|nr:acetyl-CoA C-acetyltransferase [Thermosporothrix hazakensis]PZW30538.1 acetyl-CoA C-acetyltransferase [Thermosporothrix hazakensis]BBH91253.1 acetyl-CoA acetyltransferase [Thermosporothrix sp. COM3]GCE49399.1 acetyl-CoA acetyltransferase [Thermosporothrix hazakensis]
MQDIYLLAGARTPSGVLLGSLSQISAIDLSVIAAKEAIKRSGVEPGQIDQVVLGNVIQTSKDAIYFARHVALKAGLPIEVPALTVNRLCGSGLQAIVSAAQLLRLGEGKLALAGGGENMTQAPHVIRGARAGLKLGMSPQLEDSLWEALVDSYIGCGMAITAENLAEKYGLTREQVDEYALRSQVQARKAQEAGWLAEEIVPVTVKDRKGKPQEITQDEGIRDTSMEALAKLPARFREGGVVTAGNASGINDAAACVVLATESAVQEYQLKPLARLVSWGIVGVPPEIMGIGPAPAIRQALKRADLHLEDMDRVEVNEAFAAQYLAVEKGLGLDRNKTNVNGGAISIGHPLAASGARLALTLMHELRRQKLKYGVASLCIGGGQGIAAVFENVTR